MLDEAYGHGPEPTDAAGRDAGRAGEVAERIGREGSRPDRAASESASGPDRSGSDRAHAGDGRALVERAGFDPSEPRDPHGQWTSGGSSSDYASAGAPSKAEKDDHVAAVYKLNAKGEEAAKKAGRTPLTFHALTPDGNERFHTAITTAKAALKYGASVHVYEPDEYRGTKMFVTPDDKVGFALKPDGDIVTGFNNSKAQRAGDSIIALAVQQGGKKLDCFDTVLPGIYGDNGMRAVARLKWNDKHAPEGWDKKLFAKYNKGEPDVVFMVADPGYGKPYEPGDGKLVKTYEEAVALQTRSIAEIESKREHPGKGYTKNAYVDANGVIHTNNVYDAQRALFEDRKVELQADQASLDADQAAGRDRRRDGRARRGLRRSSISATSASRAPIFFAPRARASRASRCR